MSEKGKDMFVMVMIAITLVIGFTIANFLCQMMDNQNWELAAVISFHQFVALLSLAIVSRFRPRM